MVNFCVAPTCIVHVEPDDILVEVRAVECQQYKMVLVLVVFHLTGVAQLVLLHPDVYATYPGGASSLKKMQREHQTKQWRIQQ